MSAEVFDSKGGCSILWGFVCPYSKFSVHKHRKLGTTKLHRNTRKVSRYHLQWVWSSALVKFHLYYFQHQCHQWDIHCPHWIGIKKNDSTPILQGILSKPIQPKLLMFVFLKLCAMLPRQQKHVDKFINNARMLKSDSYMFHSLRKIIMKKLRLSYGSSL
jgi:hypothetical protein